jgi:hypothetical protein
MVVKAFMDEIPQLGPLETAANRSVILDFRVEDVDEERFRLQNLVRTFVLDPRRTSHGTIVRLCRSTA